MPTKIVPNCEIIGNLTVSSAGIVSGFDNSGTGSYLVIEDVINFYQKDFEMVAKFNMINATPRSKFYGCADSQDQKLPTIQVQDGHPGWSLPGTSGWQSGDLYATSYTININTWYWIKLTCVSNVFTLYMSTDGETWTSVQTRNGSDVYNNTSLHTSVGMDKYESSPNTGWSPVQGSMDLTECYIKVDNVVVWHGSKEVDVSGSINISKGYYNNGTYEIFMPDSQVYLGTLKSGETVGCKNKTFAYSYNDVAGVKITADSNNDITTTHDVSVNLSHPIYLNYAKEYIVGDTPLASLGMTFSAGGYGTDYTVVGSPTISSEYVASGFNDSNYLTKDLSLSSATSVDLILKINTGSRPSTRGVIFYNNSTGVNNRGGLGIKSDGSLIGFNGSSWTGSIVYSENTDIWVRFIANSDGTRWYGITDNSYTLDTLPDISNWTQAWKQNANFAQYFLGNMVFGKNLSSSSQYFPGSIYLKEGKLVINGVEVWRPVSEEPSSISTTTTGFLYNQTADKTFWYPSTQTLLLEDFTALNDRCNLYLVNNGNDPTGVLDVGTTSPSSVNSYLQQGYVYLNHANDKILGVGTEPDEIVLEATGSLTTDYTVVGNPTITDEYVASGFSSRNAISTNRVMDFSNPWELGLKFKTGTTVSTRQKLNGCLNNADWKFPTIEINNSKFYLCISSNGSSWDIAAQTGGSFVLSTNTVYWLKFGWTGSQYYLSYSTDGITYTQDISISNSNAAYTWTNPMGLGNDLYGSSYQIPFLGEIYLKDCYFSINGTESWRAVGIGSLDTITVDPVHNWSYYGLPTNPKINPEGTPDNYDYLGSTAQFDLDEYNDVQTIASSNPDMDGQTTGYIYIYTQITGENNLAICPKDYAIGLTGFYYTGYKIEFTDDTFAEIASLEKIGTKVRLYAAATSTTLHNYTIAYIAVTKAQYEDGISTGDVVYYGELSGQSMSMMLTEMEDTKTVGTNINYDSSTDTFSYGNWEAIYIGDFYVDLV